jgi:hypothetical protein
VKNEETFYVGYCVGMGSGVYGDRNNCCKKYYVLRGGMTNIILITLAVIAAVTSVFLIGTSVALLLKSERSPCTRQQERVERNGNSFTITLPQEFLLTSE